MSNEINVAQAPEMSTSQTGVEEWRDVVYPGVKPGRYQVSSYGRVRNVERDRILTPGREKHGYLEIRLSSGKGAHIAVHFMIHRLVAYMFLPPPLPGQTNIDHIDGNKANNSVPNLRWCTPEENANNPITLKRHKNVHHKLESALARRVICDETNASFDSLSAAAEAFGMDVSSVSKSCYTYQRRSLPGTTILTERAGRKLYHFHFAPDEQEPVVTEGAKETIRRALLVGHAKPVLCINDNKPYPSISAAARAYGLSHDSVRSSCGTSAGKVIDLEHLRKGCRTFIRISVEEYNKRITE